MKKLIALIASVCTVIGAASAAFAEAEIAYPIVGIDYVEQDCRNLTEAPSTLSVPTNGVYTENGISYSGYKSALMITTAPVESKGNPYVIESTQTFSDNIAEIRFATNSAAKTTVGYNLAYSYAKDGTKVHNFKLSKDGEIVAEALGVKGLWGSTKTRIELYNDRIDVYAASNLVLSYERDVEKVESGYVAWKDGYMSNYTFSDFKIYTPDGMIKKTNNFIIDKTFTAADTTESLAAEGIIVKNGTPGENGLEFASKTGNASLMLDGITLSGDYTFKAVNYSKEHNTTYVYLNRKDENNYYRFYLKGSSAKEYKVEKCVDGFLETVAEGAMSYDRGATDIIASVTNGENGEITLCVKITTNTIEYTDTENVITEGTVGIVSEWAGNVSVGGIQVYPTPAEGKPATSAADVTGYYVTVEADEEVCVLDKDFTSADTLETLAAEGYEIKNATVGEDKISFANTDGNGTSNALLMLNKVMSGNYSFTVKNYHKGKNYTYIYLNRKDSKNYYMIELAGSSKNWYKVYKCVDGTETMVDTGSCGYDVSTPEEIRNLVAEVKTDKAGIVTMKVSYMGNVIEYTDTENTFTSGTVGIKSSYAGDVWIGGVKLVATAGEQAFKLDTQLLCNNYTAVAALYENNKLVDVKLLSTDELKRDYAVTFRANANQVIKTFILDDAGSLKPLTAATEYAGF